ncbi:tetratricopeptide repeat protein [Azospirillum sp. ST 5-10]|uniref:tetratricopeptide repeat protein n=1 Tax=unclassified Azospirillum TaxID=2630922 RepID=UPI003F4A77FB
MTAGAPAADPVVATLQLGQTLEGIGRVDLAVGAYRRAVALQPRVPELRVLLADACQRVGRVGEAAASLAVALQLRPGDVESRNTLGVLLRGAGRSAAATACFANVLAAAPDHAPALVNLGLMAMGHGSPAGAIRWYRRALACDGGIAAAWNALGNALKAAGTPAAAVRCWEVALALDPASVDALANLGAARRDAQRMAEANALLRRGLALAPLHAPLHAVRAYVLCGQRRFDEARRACRLALAVAPALPDALCTLGLAEWWGGGRRPERWLDRAAAASPGHPLARFNRGLLDLERGRPQAGWAGYACRFEAGRAGRRRRFAIPEWTGEPLAGKRLFVWREQGVGDEFLFASCYADAIRAAEHTVIECDHRLVSLFQRSFPHATVRAEQPARGQPVVEVVDCDVHVPAGSLPRRLRPDLASFPPRAAWLFADHMRTLDWRERLDRMGGALRVGISWRSQNMALDRQWAYLPLDGWGPLFAVPGILFINLQYDDARAEIARAEDRFGVRIHQMVAAHKGRLEPVDLKNDFESTAALIANLDLVIAPANSVGELAGALGVPVWRFSDRDWTHLGTVVRPWYPTMRVFPPGHDGAAGALRRIAEAVRRVAASAHAATRPDEAGRRRRPQ